MKKQWEEEKRQLLGEKAVLQDAANRLNTQIRIAKDETKRVAESERAGEKMRVGIQGVCCINAFCYFSFNKTETDLLLRNSIKPNVLSLISRLILNPNEPVCEL